MRMVVAGSSAGHRWRGGEPPPSENTLDAAKVLGRGVDLATTSEQDDHLGARLAFEVHVGSEPDVISPAVLSGGETPEDVRGRVTVKKRHHAQRIGVRVFERALGDLLANEGTDRVRPARAVPLRDPAVEERE